VFFFFFFLKIQNIKYIFKNINQNNKKKYV